MKIVYHLLRLLLRLRHRIRPRQAIPKLNTVVDKSITIILQHVVESSHIRQAATRIQQAKNMARPICINTRQSLLPVTTACDAH